MKIVFFGTPQVAIPYIEYLHKNEDVIAVVTQTDKPSDRGQEIHKPPVKIFAEKNNIPILQPAKLKEQSFVSQISKFKADAGIAVAYGRILPKEIIDLFSKGLYNIHFSLLPLYRGAAPIQWAIYHGDKKTGVTSFKIAEALDSGNIIVQKEIEILEDDDAISLKKKLIPLGITALEETLKQLKKGKVNEKSQIGNPTVAPLIKKSDAKIDWNRSAREIHNQVRAFIQIGTFCRLPDQKILKLLKTEVANPKSSENFVPGTVCEFEKNRGFLVKCNQNNLLVLKVQVEGKKETDAWSFLQGHKLKIGDRLN